MNRGMVQIGLVLACWLAAQPARAETNNAAPELVTPALINRLAEEARTNNQALAGARQRISAAAAGRAAIRSWEDPMFGFGGVVASSRGMMLDQEGDLIYRLEEKLPVFNKPKYARAVATAELTNEVLKADYEFQSLRRDIALQILKVAEADETESLARADLAWLEAQLAAMEDKYRLGLASQSEVLRMQSEQIKARNQAQTYQTNILTAGAGLNRLLNRPLENPWPDWRLPEVAPQVPLTPALIQLSLQYEPRLKVMDQEIRIASATVRNTQRQRLPEVSLGVEGRQYSGDAGFREGMFTMGLSLPWFNQGKYRQDVGRDQARLRAAELDRNDYEQSARNEVRQLTLQIGNARREALAYREEIIPRARQAVASALADWQSARGSLREVLDSRRFLLESQSMQVRAVAEQYRMLAELVLCCGLGDLDAIQRVAAP